MTKEHDKQPIDEAITNDYEEGLEYLSNEIERYNQFLQPKKKELDKLRKEHDELEKAIAEEKKEIAKLKNFKKCLFAEKTKIDKSEKQTYKEMIQELSDKIRQQKKEFSGTVSRLKNERNAFYSMLINEGYKLWKKHSHVPYEKSSLEPFVLTKPEGDGKFSIKT